MMPKTELNRNRVPPSVEQETDTNHKPTLPTAKAVGENTASPHADRTTGTANELNIAGPSLPADYLWQFWQHLLAGKVSQAFAYTPKPPPDK